MSTVNFNDTTPGPPANFTNVHFQSDVNGNISANWGPGGAQSWAPGWSGTGGMTTTATLYWALFARLGSLVFFSLRADITTGGTPSNAITATAPVGGGTQNSSLVMGNNLTCTCNPVAGMLTINKADGTNFTTPGTTPIFLSGIYMLV